MDRLSAERHRLQAELEELTRLRVRLESNCAQSRSYQASLETEHAQLSAHLAKVQSHHQELTAQAQRINRELSEAERELHPLLATAHASRQRVHNVHIELQRAEAVLGRTEESSAELRRTIERIDAEMTFLTTQRQAAARGEVLEPPRDLDNRSGLWAVALARARANVEAADEAARSSAALRRREVNEAPQFGHDRDHGHDLGVPAPVQPGQGPEITEEIDVMGPAAPASAPTTSAVDTEADVTTPSRERLVQIASGVAAALVTGGAVAYLLLGSDKPEREPAPPPPAPVIISAEVEPEPVPAPPGGPDVTPSSKPEVPRAQPTEKGLVPAQGSRAPDLRRDSAPGQPAEPEPAPQP